MNVATEKPVSRMVKRSASFRENYFSWKDADFVREGHECITNKEK